MKRLRWCCGQMGEVEEGERARRRRERKIGAGEGIKEEIGEELGEKREVRTKMN